MTRRHQHDFSGWHDFGTPDEPTLPACVLCGVEIDQVRHLPAPVAAPPFPLRRYGMVSLDAPWLYGDRKACDPALGGFRYPPMSTEALQALPVRDLLRDDTAVFLWVTGPMSAEGRHAVVASAWGVTLVALVITWVKLWRPLPPDKRIIAHQLRGGDVRSGQGHYVRGATELCYLGWPTSKRLVRRSFEEQVLFAPVTVHSAKPDEAYHRMERMFDATPRLEMFARVARPGWDAWGYEAPKQEVAS